MACGVELLPGRVHLVVMRILTPLALLVLLGCLRMSRPVSIDPDVNFAAHVEHDQIVLDLRQVLEALGQELAENSVVHDLRRLSVCVRA